LAVNDTENFINRKVHGSDFGKSHDDEEFENLSEMPFFVAEIARSLNID